MLLSVTLGDLSSEDAYPQHLTVWKCKHLKSAHLMLRLRLYWITKLPHLAPSSALPCPHIPSPASPERPSFTHHLCMTPHFPPASGEPSLKSSAFRSGHVSSTVEALHCHFCILHFCCIWEKFPYHKGIACEELRLFLELQTRSVEATIFTEMMTYFPVVALHNMTFHLLTFHSLSIDDSPEICRIVMPYSFTFSQAGPAQWAQCFPGSVLWGPPVDQAPSNVYLHLFVLWAAMGSVNLAVTTLWQLPNLWGRNMFC